MDFSVQFNGVKDSVVNILAVVNKQPISSGTGILINDGRTAITCAHCIVPNSQVVARFSGNSFGEIGSVVHIDQIKDFAIISFQKPIGPGVKMRDSSSVQIGQEAFVVGFPSNIDKITALSANIAGFEPTNGFDLIRIDCSVNHGNSGGPLFNSSGELVGIINAKHGSLSNFLTQVEKAEPGAMMSIGGIDPVKVIQQLITEMKKNLNLGIGYAIPVNIIGQSNQVIKDLIL